MRKVVLAIFALFFSFNLYAANNDLGSAITKSLGRPNSNPGQSSTIVYGGKDISPSIVAIANETALTISPVMIG